MMKPRERTLLLTVGGAVALLVICLLVSGLAISPIRDCNQKENAVRDEIAALVAKNAQLARSSDEFSQIRNRTYDDNALRTGVMLISRINQMARKAGLNPENLSAVPFNRPGKVNSYTEVGYQLRGQASLERLTNLLYVLSRDSRLHRITSLEMTPQANEVAFTLWYSTVVLDRPTLIKGVTTRPAPTTQMLEMASLNEPQREVYDIIAKRDFFKPRMPKFTPPSIARVDGPPRTSSGSTSQPHPGPPQQALSDQMVVIGLPAFGPHAEVHVAMPGREMEKVLRVGDRLPTGEVAMVDYRVLPMPGRPEFTSGSRVILKIEKDYWAVELGQTLGQRRPLRPHELPEQLRPKPAVKPSATTAPGN